MHKFNVIVLFVLALPCTLVVMSVTFYTIEVMRSESFPNDKAKSQLWTVVTSDTIYPNLSEQYKFNNWTTYKTQEGKTIIFNGNFTEIEQ